MVTSRKDLIEEAAKAIWAAGNEWTERTQAIWDLMGEDAKDYCRQQARAALAVFEQARTPTDDYPDAEGLATLRAATPTPTDDDERPTIELARFIASWDQGVEATNRIPHWAANLAMHLRELGFRRTVQGSGNSAQNSDDEREAVEGALWDVVERLSLPLSGVEVRALAESVARRTEVPEPSVEYVRGGVCLLCGDGVLNSGEHIDPERHAAEVQRITNGAERTQGEPSDAQVLAAAGAMPCVWSPAEPRHPQGRDCDRCVDRARAALRAAAATQEGENR